MVRNGVNKRQSTTKNHANRSAPRTRRLQSSSSSDISTSALASPVTNDENNDEDLFSTKKLESDRTDAYKLRSKQPTEKIIESNSPKDSEQEEEDNVHEKEEKPITLEQESFKEYLWQPTKLPTTSTTITEVTDQTGVTVLIRQINEVPTSNSSRSSRILGYGSAGRGGRH